MARTKQVARSIKTIDKKTIKFIASGEKINDIETAVRELVENSIDAKAKQIEVRLTKFGTDAIEVEDDGVGIAQWDFGSLACRYHTSKIRDHKKLLESLDTFGFRGEALSCLCNIAMLTITTKTRSCATGSKISFKKDGSISKIEPVARDNGTTVILKNLFHSLPVRRREFVNAAKRHYDKVVKLLYEHILARPDLKFSLCKKMSNKKEKDFTHGGTTLEGCITTIFGIKVLESLIPINQDFLIRHVGPQKEGSQIAPISRDQDKTKSSAQAPTQSAAEAISSSMTASSSSSSTNCNQTDNTITTEKEPIKPVKDEFFKRACKSKVSQFRSDYSIYGYISKVGSGRNSTDCQFIYVNKKPCDIPKITRLINETYKSYTSNQYPFYCIFIEVQGWAADFNVPRKRAVILQDEIKLFNLVKDTLDKLFSPYAPASQRFCPVAQIPLMISAKSNHGSPASKEQSSLKRSIDDVEPSNEDMNDTPAKKIMTQDDRICTKQSTEQAMATEETSTQQESQESVAPIELPTSKRDLITSNFDLAEEFATPTPEKMVTNKSVEATTIVNDDSSATEFFDVVNSSMSPTESSRAPGPKPKPSTGRDLPETLELQATKPVDRTNGFVTALECLNELKTVTEVPDTETEEPSLQIQCRYEQVESSVNDRLQVKIMYPHEMENAILRERHQESVNPDSMEFSFSINPKFNALAEQQLKLNLNKTSFRDMKILGQFNRGFIITQLNKHIFIIDQHATDERANYEDQLDKSPLIKQTMVCPKPLYLNMIQENVIIDNLDVFKEKGFEFVIDRGQPVGFRVKLSSTSICKGHSLDEYLTKEDVEELIDVAIEAPNNLKTYCLKKVRSVAATRACRKSVMIGHKLTWSQMESIVHKMADLRNPWVCAHNRPTIRHLMDVDWVHDIK